MTAGEPVAPPLCFRGKQPTGGRGWGIDPFPDVSRRRHAALRRGNRQGKVFAKSMERGDPSGWANASWGHTRGPQEARAGHWPLHRRFPPPPCRPASGERQGKVFAKSMERRDPSGLANASWGHTRGSQGAGWGLGPLTWASRHRRGGLPNKVIGGRPPSHGAGGHLMYGARGAEKGGERQDESRREQEGEPQLPFPLVDAGVRRLCTQARPSPGPSGWTGPNPAD